jgi:uncharacterized protein
MFNCVVFSNNNNFYLFDGVSGNILSIDEDKVEGIKNFFTLESSQRTMLNTSVIDSEIKQAIENNFIKPVPQKEVVYWFNEEEYFKTLFEEMSHLMIGVTENCNMRCKYCVYGGHYPNERTHKEVSIKKEKIIKIIDRFYELSKNKQKVINFYGGEPFLCFSEIKEATNYLKKYNDNVQIYITTNGTLLSDEVCRWFSENLNVHIYVSIAGIPKWHDQLRVFINGNPTFETIHKNLIKLKSCDPVAYAERVHFVFNIFDEKQLFELQDFWSNHEIFKTIKILPEITFIDCVDDDGMINEMGEKISKNYKNEASPLSEYIRLLQIGELDNLIVKHYDNKFLGIHRRTSDETPIISGVCRPFVKKLFVDTKGNLHLCENFSYGNKFKSIFNEFPILELKELLNLYKNFKQDNCSKCWASKLCSLCFRDLIDRDGTVNLARSKKICINEKESLKKLLKEYCTVLENSPTLLDHLDDYIIYV